VLVEKLGIVSRAVSMRPTVQILSGISLQAESGRLALAATDMELSLRTSLDADVASQGVTVDYHRILDAKGRASCKLVPDRETAADMPEADGGAAVRDDLDWGRNAHLISGRRSGQTVRCTIGRRSPVAMSQRAATSPLRFPA
jgi:hypothetical protein